MGHRCMGLQFCFILVYIMHSHPSPVIIASRSSLIVADSLLVIITWISLFQKGALHLALGTTSFSQVLLYDGKCAPSYIKDIVSHARCSPQEPSTLCSMLFTFSNLFFWPFVILVFLWHSMLCISHFPLNLSATALIVIYIMVHALTRTS